MREREAKLVLGPGVRLPDPEKLLRGLGRWSVEEIVQEAVYFDTSDLRLTRAGASLRYRSDDGWTVKIPEAHDGATFVRQEHSFSGVDGTIPVAAHDLVLGRTRSGRLEEVAKIRTNRRRLVVHDRRGTVMGEVDEDDVTASVPGRDALRFREVEVELAEDADERLLETLVERLRKAGAGSGRSMPKIARALGDRASEPPDVVASPLLDHRATVEELVCSSITAGVGRLLDHDPIVRSSDDPEGVHQARVATRRLRSDLRTFRPVLDTRWSEPLRAELRWLGGQLGRVRDADVLLALMVVRIKGLPDDQRLIADELVERLRTTRVRDRDLLLEAMRSPRYIELIDTLVEAARSPRLRGDIGPRRAAKRVGKLVRRPWKRLRKQVARLPADDAADGDLHEIRKRAKQARYALDAIIPVRPRARRGAKRLAALQDVLGDHQDSVVASAWLHDAAKDSAESELAFVAGRLAGSFDADRRRLRVEWPDAWKRVKHLDAAIWR